MPPARLIEFIGGGINQWTAAEGALKIREAAYVASEGLAVEQFLHGPSVALGPDDRLVCLDGGSAWSARIAEVAQAAEQAGVPVTRVADDRLGELLSIFPADRSPVLRVLSAPMRRRPPGPRPSAGLLRKVADEPVPGQPGRGRSS